jgi:integrase
MKMKKEHIVPLSRQAIEILKELREIHNHPVFVFPSRGDRNKTMSNNTIVISIKN